MKIASASKKVLASALSAAMVVAFAPTVAFASDLGSGTTTAGDKGTEAVQVTYYDGQSKTWKAEKFSANVTDEDYGKGIQGAFDFAAEKAGDKGATVQLLSDITADVEVAGTVTIDLNGFTWTNAGADESNDTTADDTNTTSPITVKNKTVRGAAAVTTTSASLVAATEANKTEAVVGYRQAVDGITAPAWKMVTKASSSSPLYINATEIAEGANLDLNSQAQLAAGDIYTYGETKTVKVHDTSSGKDVTIKYVVGEVHGIGTDETVDIDGTKYVAANVSSKTDDELALYSVIATSKTVTPATADTTIKAAVTIADSSEAKTGTITGNQVDVDDKGKGTTVAKPAVTIASGTLAVEGGTITTGAADLKVASASTLKAIEGTVESVEDATIEAVGGYYEGTVGTASKAHIGQRVETVYAKSVKDSTIKATAGDYGAVAVALYAYGDVESSTIEAVSGIGYNEDDPTPDKVADAYAIVAENGGTYKKVAATATANGATAESKDASGATLGRTYSVLAKSDVTINSGEYNGDRAILSGSITMKGGKFSQHIGAATPGTLGAGCATVCLGEGAADYVYTKSAAENATYTDYAAAVNTAIDHVYEAAIKGEDPYSVGYAFAEGYDAAALAAAVTDADEAKNLVEYAIVSAGTEAKTVKAPATLTADEEAFNAVVAAADEAAEAEGVTAYTYANLAAYVKYEKGTTKKDVLSVSDLGNKDKDIDAADSHVDGTVGLKANEVDIAGIMENGVFVHNTANGMIGNTKSAVDVATADELAVVEGKANKLGTAYEYKVTKLGGYATVSDNGESVKDELEKQIDELTKELGTIIDTQGKTIDELNAIIASLKAELADKSAAELVATQDRNAVENVYATKTKTVKLAKGVTKTKKAQTITYSTKVSASGNVVTYAKRSGSSKITVDAAGAVKLAKGVKKGTYTAKVKVTCGEQTRTVTAVFVVK